MKPIRFTQPPVPGHAFVYQGQRYVLIRSEPYVRKDGQHSRLLTWQSHFADCGQPFVQTTGMGIYHVNRRCDKHKSPGRLVAGGRYRPIRRRKVHG